MGGVTTTYKVTCPATITAVFVPVGVATATTAPGMCPAPQLVSPGEICYRQRQQPDPLLMEPRHRMHLRWLHVEGADGYQTGLNFDACL